ncbi:hypothetical protein D6D04_05225 [Aureobasidium pullulans]|nr:hypothetical protein D6D04_05225 [Aureobasidium pullulans]
MLALLRPRSPLPPTAAAATTTDALDDALRSFQDSLDPEQKTKFLIIKAVPDAHAVAEFTHQLDQENAKRQSRCVSARISPLLESIQRFSGIVETFVSSHPQIAALIWGSIKLVLQIASNFTAYFDDLSGLLMTIGKRCPRFHEYQKLYGHSTGLQKALCDFYAAIFVQWSVGDNSGVFWCTGKLGSGKTVMTGYIVQEMSAKSSPGTEKLAYFFCQHDNEASLQATTILKSIIKQCLDQDEKLYDVNTLAIDALLESPNDLDGLEAFLSKLVSGLSRIVIILDGIDECSNKEMKTTLKSLRKLVLQKTSGLKLYLAGDERITDLIASFLNPIHGMNTGCLEARIDLQALVRQLVATKRQDEDLVIGDDHLHQEIVDVLCTASQGMLLWIMFQLEELCSRKTDESIRTALKNLPKDLFETYNRLLARIVEEGSMDVCKKVFRYMAVAKRPLTSEELGEAISIEPCQPYFMRERMINNPTNIIRWCHGLAVLDELNETLQFAHSSVRDFFCSLETEHVVLHGFHFVQEQVDREFGDICVTYLSFNDFKQQLAKSPKQPLLLNPMVMANQALTSDTSSILLQEARELINKRHKSTMILATGDDLNRELDDTGKSALHVAATFKCVHATGTLLRNGAAVNATDIYGQTALHKLVLAPGDHKDVVEIAKELINNDAVIDAKDFEGKSVLEYAADDLRDTLRRLYEEHHGIRFIE